MNDTVIRKILETMRAALDAAFLILDGPDEEDEINAECTHPADSRIDMSTMGGEEWQCSICCFHYPDDLEKG